MATTKTTTKAAVTKKPAAPKAAVEKKPAARKTSAKKLPPPTARSSVIK